MVSNAGSCRHVALACATNRGLRVAQRVRKLLPDVELTVFTFREEQWEPPFLSDFESFAAANQARLIETRQLHAPSLEPFWSDSPPDLLLAASWRYLIPDNVLQSARLGTFVFHDSLLPRYRGFAPTVWAMINGDAETGVSLFRLMPGNQIVDSGPIVDQAAVPIGPDEEIGRVMTRVTDAYLELVERNLAALAAGSVQLTEQDEALATYTCKRTPQDARIDWRRPAREIFNLIRASTHPYPGAFSSLKGEKVTIWSADPIYLERRFDGTIPGRVIERRPEGAVVVLTGEGCLLIPELQRGDDQPVEAALIARSLNDTFS
jgi:methionyl-tRNA formyltransferase